MKDEKMDVGAVTGRPKNAPATGGRQRNAPAAKPEYEIEALVDGARQQFNCAPELAAAALKSAGAERYTPDAAKGIIEKFMRKVVK